MRLLVATALLVLCAGTLAHAQPADPRQRDAGYIGKDIPLLEIDDCPAPAQVSPDELERRKAAWVRPEPKIRHGWLGRYSRMVTSASKGAMLE